MGSAIRYSNINEERGVGERSERCEGHDASRTGAFRSENVGTSNRKAREIRARRKPKVSLAMVINQGLAGPKPMAKAAGDGQPVNIPALPYSSDGVTEEIKESALLNLRFCTKEVFSR